MKPTIILERYNSFEEMKKASVSNRQAKKAPSKKRFDAIKSFAEILRHNKTSSKK